MSELNNRQKALYDFLYTSSETSPNYYFSKEELCVALHDFYPRHLESSSEHNSRSFCMLRKDVRTINFSDVEKIIVSNKTGYKLATKEEAEIYLKRKLKSSLVALKLYWKLKHKAELNRQLDINLHEIETFIGD